MSRSVNKVILMGNVGSDPDIRTTGGGSRVAKLSLATNRRWTDSHGETQEKTEWHRLTVFGKPVDIVEDYVQKGDRLYVEGRLEYSQSEDRSGETRYWTDVIVTELVLIGPNQSSAQRDRPAPREREPERAPSGGRSRRVDTTGERPRRQAPPAASPFEADDDDIPF